MTTTQHPLYFYYLGECKLVKSVTWGTGVDDGSVRYREDGALSGKVGERVPSKACGEEEDEARSYVGKRRGTDRRQRFRT